MRSSAISLDIVIPVLNEEAGIAAMLTSLKEAVAYLKRQSPESIVSIIAVDGGSSDQTSTIITEQHISLSEVSIKGRGYQIAKGIASGAGDWIVILHADSLIKKEGLYVLSEAISCNQACAWGVIGHTYDQAGIHFWFTRLFNRLRFKVLGLGYGDQGQFVRRKILMDRGGFPEQPLMEDVELSLILKGLPRLFLGEFLTASSRQWKKRGFWSYTIQNLTFVWGYIRKRNAGGSAVQLSTQLYDEYYRK